MASVPGVFYLSKGPHGPALRSPVLLHALTCTAFPPWRQQAAGLSREQDKSCFLPWLRNSQHSSYRQTRRQTASLPLPGVRSLSPGSGLPFRPATGLHQFLSCWSLFHTQPLSLGEVSTKIDFLLLLLLLASPRPEGEGRGSVYVALLLRACSG